MKAKDQKYWDEYSELLACKGGPFVPSSYIDEMVRGYRTGEYSHHTRDRTGIRTYDEPSTTGTDEEVVE